MTSSTVAKSVEMAEFFDITTWCPESAVKLHHRDVTSTRCVGCGLQRPNTLPIRSAGAPSTINDDDEPVVISSAEPSPVKPLKPVIPAHRVVNARATHFPKGKLAPGRVESARRELFTPKAPPAAPSSIFFSIIVARPALDAAWETLNHAVSRSEPNRKLTFQELFDSLWRGPREDLKRPGELAWLHPAGEGYWLTAYNLPKYRTPPVAVEQWKEPWFLAEVVADGWFPTSGGGKSDTWSIVFIWIDEETQKDPTPASTPRNPPKRGK